MVGGGGGAAAITGFKMQNYVVKLPNKGPVYIFHHSQSDQLPSEMGPEIRRQTMPLCRGRLPGVYF